MQNAIASDKIRYPQNAARTFINRSGADTVLGGFYFVDSSQSDADSTTVELGLKGAVKPTTALMALLPRGLICVEGGVGDNLPARFVETDGAAECVVSVNSTADIAAGDKLKPVNAQTYLVKASTQFTATTAGTETHDHYYAEALQARTADTTGTIRAIFYSRPAL